MSDSRHAVYREAANRLTCKQVTTVCLTRDDSQSPNRHFPSVALQLLQCPWQRSINGDIDQCRSFGCRVDRVVATLVFIARAACRRLHASEIEAYCRCHLVSDSFVSHPVVYAGLKCYSASFACTVVAAVQMQILVCHVSCLRQAAYTHIKQQDCSQNSDIASEVLHCSAHCAGAGAQNL